MPTLEEAMLMAEGGSEENPYIVINNDLRTITPPTSTLLLGVYNDKEVLKVPFKMPRYYDDIDLSRFSIQINYINAMRIPNFDEADDIVVEDDHITFNWTTKRSVFLKDGTVQFSVCLRLSDIDGNVSKEFNTTIGYGIVLEGIEADADSEDPEAYSIIAHMIQIKNYVDGKSDAVAEVIDTAIDTITAKQSRVEELVEEASEAIDETRSMVSYPNVAETAAAMSDQTKIYVYTGSETGYNTGHWYYYKTGSGWTDGGLYMSQGVNTDTTLTFPDTPADAKATGIALSKKADYDGSYRELTSGDTYQIMSKKTVSDSGLMYPRKVETLFPNKTLGGKAFRDKLIGGSIVWNQLIQNGDFSNGISSWVDNPSGSLTVTNGVCKRIINQSWNNDLRQRSFRFNLNHVYLFSVNHKESSENVGKLIVGNPGTTSYITFENSTTMVHVEKVFKPTTITQPEEGVRLTILKNGGEVLNEYYEASEFQLFDLTQMFGSTIADYIYDLEQNSEGAGVAYFRKYFPNDYYEYNPGEIISVTPGKFESVGFNIWDEEWEIGGYSGVTGAPWNTTDRIRSKAENYIQILPNVNYYNTSPVVIETYYYRADKSYISYSSLGVGAVFTTPANAKYMRFFVRPEYGTTYNHDICINLSDPDKNGIYEPYEHHSYPLDSTLTLRGIPKLDESNNLYYDGDTYEADGKVTRRYGIVDLGTISWVYDSNFAIFTASVSGIKNGTYTDSNLVCSKYPTTPMSYSAFTYGMRYNSATSVGIKDSSYTDATAFKEAMSGVMLVYELATPTVETLNPVSSPQSIALTGMEELTDREYEAGNRDVFLPAWHETRYTLDVVGEIAFKNSYHDTLGAGVADQLMSKKKLTDTEPYTFRKTGGNLTGIGNRVYDEIVGGTVCWNQHLRDINNIVSVNGGTKTYDENTKSWTLTPTNMTFPNFGFWVSRSEFDTKIDHKIIFTISIKPSGVINNLKIGVEQTPSKTVNIPAGIYTTVSTIVSPITNSAVSAYINLSKTELEDFTMDVKNIQIFDLTQMFGSTIADYIYNLEQQTEGAGVAYFRKYFPNDYYEYNPGELMSVSNLVSHDSVGFNQWDEEWELGGIDGSTGKPYDSNTTIRCKNFIPVLPNTAYYIFVGTNVNTAPWYYDAKKNFVSRNKYIQSGIIVIPDNCYYMKIAFPATYGVSYNHDICINLSDPDKNGTYEPYVKHSYPLDSMLTLRGIPKLDESNNLYYDGDTYEADGTVIRRYGIVDLGTFTWVVQKTTDSGEFGFFYVATSITNASHETTNNVVYSKGICSKFFTGVTPSEIYYGNDGGGHIAIDANGRIRVSRTDDTTDATAFKEAMSGVMLIYELATPTIETAEPYQSPQVVDGGGTEEYVTNNQVKIPIGHNSSYGLDLGGKLETIVDTPSDDGTYTLKVTVTNGVPVFSWS